MGYILSKKLTLIFIPFFIPVFLFSCFSKFGPVKCNYNDPMVDALCRVNNELNEAISNKDWETIYNMKLKAEEVGVGGVDSKEAFIKSANKSSFGGSFNIKMISYKIENNTAETKNYIETRVFFWPFKVYPDTSIHYWEFKNSEWYLYDWDRRPKWE